MSNTTNIKFQIYTPNWKLVLIGYLILEIGLLVLIGSIFTQNASAASFSEAYVRLDRTKANTALSGTVCAKPSSGGAGTEAKIAVTFPSDFNIASTASNWTTSTSSLPSGAAAWPGISTSAASVSDQTVTFTSNNLTASSLYCFNFSSSSSSTSASGNDKYGTLSTKNGSDSVIDSKNYSLSIVNNDRISVSASVPQGSRDYSVSIAKLTETPSGGSFFQDDEIEFRITYGSLNSISTDFTLEASWSKGTMEGYGNATIDSLEYVSGSAGNAYGSSKPVIDTLNNKITWEIANFPANTTGQTVKFKLKTTAHYTGSTKVNFTPSARIIFSGGTTPYSNFYGSYKYKKPAAPSPTTASITTTPTPTPAPSSIKAFDVIEVREIADKSAKIFIQTPNLTRKTIRYGESSASLTSSKTDDFSTSSTVVLSDLKPTTKYYFRVTAISSSNAQISSDIFTFTTSLNPSNSRIEPASLVVTSLHNIISDSKVNGNTNTPNSIVIPESTIFKFRFALNNYKDIKRVTAYLRNKQVLGFNSQALANSDSVELTEVEPGVFEGSFLSKPNPGEYEVIARIEDIKGNVIEQKVTELKITNKFKILSKKNNIPLAGARVFLNIFNTSEKRFIPMNNSVLINGNPVFTDSKGELNLALSKGRYRAEIDEIGYKETTVDFNIGFAKSDGYPIVYLESEKISPFSFLMYHTQSLENILLYNTVLYADSLSSSGRFFDLVSLITLSSLVILSLYAFSRKHLIPLSTIHSYFFYLLDRTNKSGYIHGVVYDEGDKPLALANVYLTDGNSEEIVNRAKTNKNGEFYFRKNKGPYFLMIMKKGFETTPQIEYHERKDIKFKVNLKSKNPIFGLRHYVTHYINSIFSISFELILLLTFIFEFLFIPTFGLIKTLPFLLMSLFNFSVWILHIRHSRNFPY